MPNQQTRRVKILNTSFNEKNNLVKWLVKDAETGKEVTLSYVGDDLIKALNLKISHIPPDAMKDFCQKMIGKELSLVMIPEKSLTDIESCKEESGIQEISDTLDKYPYHEIINEINQDIENAKDT